MKKLTALLMALCMLCTVALAEETTTYTAGTYFSIAYPSSLTLDDTTYDDERTDDSVWLFMLYDDTLVVDASMETIDDYEGFSLYNATDEEKRAYIDEALDSFADNECEYVDTFETTANGIPFFVFSMEDADGPYYYIETIANGTSLSFCTYYVDGGELDDELLNDSIEILESFKPVV